MIVKKRVLIESVLSEITINNVLSGEHYSEVEPEVNAMTNMEEIKATRISAYREALQGSINFLEKDENNIDRWAILCNEKLGLKEMNIPNNLPLIKKFIQDNDLFTWVSGKITDPHILNSLAIIKYGEMKSEKEKSMSLITAVYIDLAYFLSVEVMGGD